MSVLVVLGIYLCIVNGPYHLPRSAVSEASTDLEPPEVRAAAVYQRRTRFARLSPAWSSKTGFVQ
jgi:hypothetical protein